MTSNVASGNWDDLSIAAMARLRFAVRRRSDTAHATAHDLTLGSPRSLRALDHAQRRDSQDKNYEKNDDEQESSATDIHISLHRVAHPL
ncbi:MAG: hypothetical protein Q7T78_03275 [Rhodoferax sp.]|nr:hypothetical protein [Rhodoferax sp.]